MKTTLISLYCSKEPMKLAPFRVLPFQVNRSYVNANKEFAQSVYARVLLV